MAQQKIKKMDRFFDPRSAKTFTRITFDPDNLKPNYHFSNGAVAVPMARPIPFMKEYDYGYIFADGVFTMDQNEFHEKVNT